MNEEGFNDGGLSRRVIGAAIEVHRHLGPGLLESAYERALCHELELQGITYVSQLQIPCLYKGVELGNAYRVDILVDSKLVVEIKATNDIGPIAKAQTVSYLKLGSFDFGLIINFNEVLLHEGIQRVYRPK